MYFPKHSKYYIEVRNTYIREGVIAISPLIYIVNKPAWAGLYINVFVWAIAIFRDKK